MLVPIKKAAGGFKTTTATASNYATDSIATGASKTSAGRVFHAYPGQRTDRLEYRAVQLRDTIHNGASHTTEYAGNLPDSEVFSRPEFEDGPNFRRIYGFGAGSVYPQGRQHGVFHVTKPSSTRCPSQAASGFQSQYRAETMTNVNRTTTPKKGTQATAPTQSATQNLGSIYPLIRQQAIENALSDALHFIRTDHPGHSLCLATARTRRALSMLKQANAEISQAVRTQIGGEA